jgi:hypothetical protein
MIQVVAKSIPETTVENSENKKAIPEEMALWSIGNAFIRRKPF